MKLGDFLLYVTVAVAGLIVAGLIALYRRVRAHNARVLRSMATAGGYTVLDEGDSMSEVDLDELLDRAGDTREPAPIVVWIAEPDEWEAAVQREFDRLGTSFGLLRKMAADRDFPTLEHRKLWLTIGGQSYQRGTGAEIAITRPDGER